MNSTCGALLNSTLSGISGGNLTIFAPTDKAWFDTFDMTNFEDFSGLNCTDDYNSTIMDCYDIFSSNTSSIPIADLAQCLPMLSLYHISPQRFDNLSNYTGRANVTVISSALDIRKLILRHASEHNSTHGAMRSHIAAFNVPQVIVANTTSQESMLTGGAASNASIINTYQANDGRLYLINRVLTPPLPLNSTISALNLNNTQNSTEISSFSTRGNITVFYPVGLFNETPDLASLTLPGIFYLNMTNSTSANLTTFAGNPVFIEYGGNTTALLNHNVSVVQPNIPLNNGVLHLVNGTIGAFNVSNTFAAQALRSNMNMWVRWLRQ